MVDVVRRLRVRPGAPGALDALGGRGRAAAHCLRERLGPDAHARLAAAAGARHPAGPRRHARGHRTAVGWPRSSSSPSPAACSASRFARLGSRSASSRSRPTTCRASADISIERACRAVHVRHGPDRGAPRDGAMPMRQAGARQSASRRSTGHGRRAGRHAHARALGAARAADRPGRWCSSSPPVSSCAASWRCSQRRPRLLARPRADADGAAAGRERSRRIVG